MPLVLAEALVLCLTLYSAIGLIFGLWFVFAGVGRVDPVARQGSKGFRLMILPGAAALWPLLLARLLGGRGRPPEERNAHREAAR